MRLLKDGHMVAESVRKARKSKRRNPLPDEGRALEPLHWSPSSLVERPSDDEVRAVQDRRAVAVGGGAEGSGVAPSLPGGAGSAAELGSGLEELALRTQLDNSDDVSTFGGPRGASMLEAATSASARSNMAAARLLKLDEFAKPEGDFEIPEQKIKNKPPSMPEKAYRKIVGAWTTFGKYRRQAYGAVNFGATVAAAVAGTDNCILKLLFIFYSPEEEDDYPYLPQHCGIQWGDISPADTDAATADMGSSGG